MFNKIIDRFIKDGKSPFCKVVLLKKKYAIEEEKSFLKRFFLKKTRELRQLKIYRDIANNYEITNIFTSNVNNLSTQYLLYKASKKSKTVCHYIEDGLFSYVERPVNKISVLNLYFNRIKYSFPYKFPAAEGSSEWVSHAWLLNPELAIATIQQKTLKNIELSWLNSSFMNKLSKKMLHNFYVDIAIIKKINVLVVLDVLTEMNKYNSKHELELLSFIKNLVEKGKVVAVKSHPRDSNKLDGVSQKVVMLPGSLPAEFLLPHLSNEVFVTGDFSTVFIDLKIMNPTTEIVIVQTNLTDNSFNSLFKQQNIKIVTSYEELKF